MKRRIKENVWGNWYGYEGTRRVISFSESAFASQEELANEWLNHQEDAVDSLANMRFGSKTGPICL